MALDMQAALEQAAVHLIRQWCGYREQECGRTFDGRPPPMAPNVYAAVWHDGARQSEWRTGLFEVFALSVTVTVRCVQPFDRWVVHRDDLETRLNLIAELIHKDTHNNLVSNAAESLAGLTGPQRPNGYSEGLKFIAFDPVEVQGPDWFHAELDRATNRDVGLSQRARYGDNKRLRRNSNLRG